MVKREEEVAWRIKEIIYSMFKKLLLILFLISLLAIQLSSPQLTISHSNIEGSNEFLKVPHDKYVIYAKFFENNLTVTGFVKVTHYNRISKSFKELYFHIYPNAFRKYGGYIKIVSVEDGKGNSLSYRIQGPDNTILHIYLKSELKPFASITINITFIVKVPYINDRFGYYDGILALGNWYPIIAVYDERKGWHLEPYCHYGESFHFYFSDYEVFLEVDRGVVVACTGVLVSKVTIGERVITHWVANNVREIAIVASKHFEVSKIKLWNITIYSYYLKNHKEEGEFALNVAYKALKVFSEHFGPYPYPVLRVCEFHGWYGGMEYPMLVMISSKLYDIRRRNSLETVIAHEIAHQWWYVVVANDEASEPWLDEAFAQYSEVLYYEWVYGKRTAKIVFNNYIKRVYYNFLMRGKDRPVALSVWEYSSYEYYPIVYCKGACVLHMLRFILGDDAFFRVLRKWYEYGRFKFVRISDFIELVERESQMNLSWFFNYWLYSTGNLEYKIMSIKLVTKAHKSILLINITQISPSKIIPMYVPLTIILRSFGKLTLKVFVNCTTLYRVEVYGIPRMVILNDEEIIIGCPKSVINLEEIYYRKLFSSFEIDVVLLSMYSILTFIVYFEYSKLSKRRRKIRRKVSIVNTLQHQKY